MEEPTAMQNITTALSTALSTASSDALAAIATVLP